MSSQNTDQKFKDLIQKLEQLVRSGRAQEARSQLHIIASQKIPRAYVQPISALARRADVTVIGLRLLNPIIHPDGKKFVQPTDLEKIEYSFCLSNSGAQQEALRLLDSVDVKNNPQGLLAKSFALINSWNYRDAIPLLKSYALRAEIDPYSRLVANVNLAASLVSEEQSEEAENIISRELEVTVKGNYRLLQGKLLGYRAQNAIQARLWVEAGKYLKEAEDYLNQMGGVDGLLMRKWHAVYDIHLSNKIKKDLHELRSVRSEAERVKHWETIRHCDFLDAVFTKNKLLAQHVYFGTPYESFKAKLVKEFGSTLELPDVYGLNLGDVGAHATEIKVLIEESYQDKKFKQGHASHRALLALASDFYRPIRVTALHYALFPDDFFNPFSSRGRVHQALRRLRISLKKNRIPLVIEEADGLYKLGASKAVSLLVPKVIEGRARADYRLESIVAKWPTQSFSVSEAAKFLNVETRTVLTVLQNAIEKGLVTRTGKGPATRYCFMQSKHSKAA